LIFKEKNFKKIEYATPLLWAIAVIAVFLIPETKLKHYMIPAIPTAALFISRFWFRYEKHILLKMGSYSTAFILFIVLLLQAGVLFVAKGWIPFFLLIASLTTTGFSIFFLIKKSLPPAAQCYALLLVLLMFTASYFTFEALPAKALTFIEPQRDVGVFRKQIYLYTYYLDRKTTQITTGEEVKKFLKNNGNVIIAQGFLEEIQKDTAIKCPPVKKLYTWEQWKPRTSAGEIFRALKSSDTSGIKEEVYIIEMSER